MANNNQQDLLQNQNAPPSPTPEELKAKEAEEQKQKEFEAQKQKELEEQKAKELALLEEERLKSKKSFTYKFEEDCLYLGIYRHKDDVIVLDEKKDVPHAKLVE
jgi:hypothetical protein